MFCLYLLSLLFRKDRNDCYNEINFGKFITMNNVEQMRKEGRQEGRKEGKKEGRKERRKERRKEGKKEGRMEQRAQIVDGMMFQE
jgi:hypothetical protein